MIRSKSLGLVAALLAASLLMPAWGLAQTLITGPQAITDPIEDNAMRTSDDPGANALRLIDTRGGLVPESRRLQPWRRSEPRAAG